MGIFSNTSNFDVLVEKATSQLLLEPDWNSILQICDCVRQEDVNPKYAVAVMKRKIYDKNPHVAKYGLIVLEACVKNCGAPMHKEVATKDMMDSFRELAKSSPEPVKEQILSMIQTWSMAFRKEPKYKIVQDTFNLMRMEGYKFPPISESSDALFTAETAPEWAEGDVCHMCRVKFSTFQRQHHCRNCGQVFCQKCSSKVSIIPQYGIEREVRVCDPCFYKLNPSASKNEEGSKKSDKVSTDSDLPPEYLSSSLSRESQTPPKKSAKEIQEEEEEELQLAMALSLSQEEAAKDGQIRPRIKSSTYSEASEPSYSSHKQTSNLYSSTVHDVEPDSASMDPELARYLNRSYWEERNERQTSSAPASAPVQREELNSYSEQKIVSGILKGKKKKKGKKTPSDNFQPVDDGVASETSFEVSDAMVKTFQGNVVMLLDRMQKVSAQGKHIAMDATAQSLFQTVSAMHPQILRLIELQEEEKAKYEALHVKLGLVREARSSLDEMRKQHREKVRQQELEQDTLRRLQIEEKLELMRQQKAEYLAYQQRLQAERQATIEQQQQQQQRVQYQRPIQMQQYHYTAGGDSSPYSSLNYTPITLASSQPYTPQNAPASYTSAVPQGYQVPDAPLPSQYAAHPPSSGFLQTPPTNLMPLRNDGPTSQMEFQPQPSSLEYHPPTYASQVPPDQGSASLQPRSLGGPPPVPTAPAQVTAQAPPPQYAQVTSQHPSSQQPYGQLGGQHPPAQTQPQNLIPGAAPTDFTGQPQINPVAPSQSHLQYSQQTQLSSTRPHVPEVTPPSQLTNLPQTQPLQQGIPTQYAHPGARDTQPKPQPYQSPQRNGFPPVDASQGQPPLFSSGSVHSQLNVGQPSVHPSFQQGQPGVHSLQGPTMQQGLPMQQGPPLQQGAPLQQGPPMQQVYEPQQQQPQQLTPQQGYQPGPGQGLPSQQQPPSQYYGSAPPPQQSNPAPQRQLSDLELISFD